MMANTMDPSVSSDTVCRTQIITEEGQTLSLSPRKNAFRKDIVFEKVCCMPSSSSSSSSSSSVSTSKSPVMQCARRKTSSGSPTDDGGGGGSSSRPPCRPPSQSQKACGKGICFKDTRIISNDDDDAPSTNENESNGILGRAGKGRAMSSSNEPLGDEVEEEEEEEEEGTRELTLGQESKLPDDVVNHSAAAARSSLSTTDRRRAGSDNIRRIKGGSEEEGEEENDDACRNSSSQGIDEGRGGEGPQQDESPRRASETVKRRTESSPATKGSRSSRSSSRARALLVTDIDAVVDGHLQASASTEESSTASGGGGGGGEGHQKRLDESPCTPPTDVLWEFNGRRLSNFCQNLMTECIVLEGEDEEKEEENVENIVPPEFVARTRETCVDDDDDDDDDYSSCGHATACPMTPISPVGDGGKTRNRVPSSLGYNSSSSSRMDDSGLASTETTGEDEITTENMSDKSGIASDLKNPSTKSVATRQVSGEITPPRCAEKTSPGTAGNDSDSIIRPGGRRGRTMERGKYEASLLKDFIRPDQKKFSIAPSPPPPQQQQDFSLDVELAIWEASDFVPDRHMSAPPAVLPMRLANSEDALRSRQTSVSPQRQRPPGGPRGGSKGSKSVELLTSRHMSPSGAKIRRRTLSKEWQVLTFTTREEITTLIRPKTDKEESQVEANCRDEEHSTLFQNCHPTENNGTPSPKDSVAQRCIQKTVDRFPNIKAAEKEDLFIAESSSDFPNTDLAKLSPDSREKFEATENSLQPLLCSNDTADSNGSSSSSSSDVWEVISGALSDALRHVRWAESAAAAPIEKTKSSSAESTYDNMDAAAELESPELSLLGGGGSTLQNNNISSGNLSEPKEDDLEIRRDRNAPSPSMEMDELVKALLDIANENGASNNNHQQQQRPYKTDDESFCLFEMTTGEFLDSSSNENDFPFSRHRVDIALNDPIQLRAKVKRSAVENNFSTLIRNEAGLSADAFAEKRSRANTTTTTTSTSITNTSAYFNRNTLSPEIESAFDKSVLDRIDCSGDGDEIAVDSNDSILQISEELEIFEANANPPPPLFDSAAESLERIPAEQVLADTPLQQTDSAADGDTGRRRAASKDDDCAREVTSLSRRHAAEESAEVFPEKAFLESLFSSLGTIVFLLLAALIFHLLNRLVEHEL